MWLQFCAIALGIWLMVSSSLLPATDTATAVDRIAGAFVIWVGVLALRSVTRGFRRLHYLSGLLLVLAPWFIPDTRALRVSSVVVGCALFVLATLPGPIHQRADGGWRAILRPWRAYGPAPAHTT